MSRMSELLNVNCYVEEFMRHRSLPTERLAHAKIQKRMTHIQNQIMAYMKECPIGATDLDIQHFFGNDRSTYRTRRSELVAMGKLKNSGRTRLQDGSRRVVWEIA